MTEAIAVLGMFAIILAILRWFKLDTTQMMKIYFEAADNRRALIEKNVESIREDVKNLHNRLCEIERNRGK